MKHCIPFLLVITFFCFSCSPSHHVFHNISQWLPPDFDAKNTVLMIMPDNKKRQQRLMEDYMKANYPYKYEFITGDATSYFAEHHDKNTYRFEILGISFSHTATFTSNNGGSYSRNIVLNDFYFYDRLTDKKYPATNKGSSWSAMTFKAMIHTILVNKGYKKITTQHHALPCTACS